MTDNGQQSDTLELPRPLVQAILDILGRLPAGEVYPLLRALDEQLGIGVQPAIPFKHDFFGRPPEPVDA